MQSSSLAPLIIVVCFPIFFVALWSSIMFMASNLGGWNRVPKSFPAPGKPPGQPFGTTSVSMGWANYNNCVIAVVANGGLFLQLWFPFRLFHPPTLVPWTAFSPFTQQQFFLVKRYASDVTLRDGSVVKIYLYKPPIYQAVRAKIQETTSAAANSAWDSSPHQF